MAKQKRWEYLNDYKKDQSGKYVYCGNQYSYADEETKKNKIRAFIVFDTLLFCTVIGSGCINAAGMNNSFYVIIPYIGEVAALFMLVWNSVKILKEGGKIKEHNLISAEKYVPFAALMIMIFACIGLICSVVFVALNGFEGGKLKCIGYMILKITAFIFAFCYKKVFDSTSWQKL